MSAAPPAFYRDPALYDLIHAEGTDDEVWLLDRDGEVRAGTAFSVGK